MTEEPTEARTYYFADGEPAGRPLDEYTLAFGPGADGGLQVWQCRESFVLHENAVMVVFEEGDAISGGDGNLHRAVLCRMCAEEDLEGFDWDEMPGCYVMDLPEDLVGVETRVVDYFDEDALDLFRLSVNLSRTAEGDAGEREESGGGSIWRRLGEKSRNLF